MFTAVSPALHKALRSPTAQVYSMTNLRHYEKHANECTEIFINLMKEKEGQKVDLTEHFQWYAFDVIASVTFQRRLGFMETRKDVFGMIEFSDLLGLYFAFIGQLPFLHPYMFGNRTLIRFLKWANPSFPDPLGDLFERIDNEMQLYDREEKSEDRKDFLAQLRAKDDPSRPYYKRDMMNHLSNNVLAGSDTTAVALRAIFYFLVKNPRVYKKLMDEIDENDRAGKLSSMVTYEQVLAMPYLQAVIKEAMRVHPSNCWPLERVVPDEGATVCNIDLPKGTIVSTTAPLINTNTDIFGADAKEFNPERWLEADTEKLRIMDRTYFTFGAGSRACIGRNIALLEITKFVPQILRTFEIEWAADSAEWEIFSAWFYKQKGLVFKWKSRPKLRLADAV
ncbi:uncharacterized protein A1O9_03878 [Exophiala aquamarina CBS 119918]|uniref:Cytochrome P450 oxidoreductase n=1 Tax=Exophiala aquamarina CBS 119918 TaxID=1182545 RepID=A0A072PU08_9EURO|nr:uncharacterized protein A1O9_03878 [Exophiala aquamarina CBS 119918]KEF59035.1 hypothetical protein A1O9_03878 [Exophiala aquamarina CBS 119918]